MKHIFELVELIKDCQELQTEGKAAYTQRHIMMKLQNLMEELDRKLKQALTEFEVEMYNTGVADTLEKLKEPI